MKKKIMLGAMLMVLILLLAACGCEHEWYAASCSAPKTCSLCGETEGETLPHTWQDATCSAPKTCSVCSATEGEALPHTWLDATCTVAKTCSVCAATEGETLPHTWLDATCTVAKTCSVCSTTEGEPLPHTWQEATCTTVKTCTACNTTEGEVLPHTWQAATCTKPKTCSVCSATEGKAAAHKWQEATTEAPKTCSVCKKTEGSKLQTDSRFTTKATKELQGTWTCDVVLTDEMMGLQNFGDVPCRMTMTFGKTGNLEMSIKIIDEQAYMKKLKEYTIAELYASFAQMGLSKEQGDQAMLETYGLNVSDYVDAMLKDYDVNQILEGLYPDMVYYVANGKLYTALDWKAKFEEDAYTLQNGKLKIDNVSLEEGGEPLVWKRA